MIKNQLSTEDEAYDRAHPAIQNLLDARHQQKIAVDALQERIADLHKQIEAKSKEVVVYQETITKLTEALNAVKENCS